MELAPILCYKTVKLQDFRVGYFSIFFSVILKMFCCQWFSLRRQNLFVWNKTWQEFGELNLDQIFVVAGIYLVLFAVGNGGRLSQELTLKFRAGWKLIQIT